MGLPVIGSLAVWGSLTAGSIGVGWQKIVLVYGAWSMWGKLLLLHFSFFFFCCIFQAGKSCGKVGKSCSNLFIFSLTKLVSSQQFVNFRLFSAAPERNINAPWCPCPILIESWIAIRRLSRTISSLNTQRRNLGHGSQRPFLALSRRRQTRLLFRYVPSLSPKLTVYT